MSEPHIQSGSRRGKLALACFGVAAVAVVITGVLSRQADSEEVATWTQERLIPTVSVVKPTYGVNTEQLDLAGRLQPFRQASIYARVDGYIKSWDHDIGALVKAGDILAELDTPELDEQMMQARADVTRSKADVELADSTVKRWRKLVETNAVTAQELEQRENSYRSAAAALRASNAAFWYWPSSSCSDLRKVCSSCMRSACSAAPRAHGLMKRGAQLGSPPAEREV